MKIVLRMENNVYGMHTFFSDIYSMLKAQIFPIIDFRGIYFFSLNVVF